MGRASVDIETLDLEAFMREALAEAEAAGEAGELPIGAVLVVDGAVVSRGRARHRESRSQIRHAELNALLAAGDALWQAPDRAVLFSTVEPCPLCLGAAVMADVPQIVFALADKVVHSQATLDANPYIRRHIQTYRGGVLRAESIALFERYDPATLRYILTARSA